jgi:hypothetical protein
VFSIPGYVSFQCRKVIGEWEIFSQQCNISPCKQEQVYKVYPNGVHVVSKSILCYFSILDWSWCLIISDINLLLQRQLHCTELKIMFPCIHYVCTNLYKF